MGYGERKWLAVPFFRAHFRPWIACRVASILKMIHRRLFHFDDSKPISGVNGLPVKSTENTGTIVTNYP
jgi:hypothetical protein